MSTLTTNATITKEQILEDHKNGNAFVKKFIEKTWPQLFEPKNDYKKITSFKDACKVLKLDPIKCLPKAPAASKEFASANEAHFKLMVIAKAIRGNWKPNWKDGNEKKYYCWFNLSVPSGFGFSSTHYDYTRTYAHVGSRLCFPTSEMAEHFGKNFTEIHKAAMTI